jgi:ribonuclease HII
VCAARRPARRRWSDVERSLRLAGGPLIAGVDEVGRGPLAVPGVDDSKALSPLQRARLASKIRERALAIALGAASPREIDRYNILNATILAMRRAISRLSLKPDHVLIDGVRLRTLGVEHVNVVGGDSRCFSIACASIIAKVTRDRVMASLARRHPGYGWDHNSGYATAAHMAGLFEHGLTPHHRRSFTADRQLELDLLSQVSSDPLATAGGTA